MVTMPEEIDKWLRNTLDDAILGGIQLHGYIPSALDDKDVSVQEAEWEIAELAIPILYKTGV